MLVLSRDEGESIDMHFGELKAKVTVVRAGDKVRIGIEAPKEIKILRDELEPFEENNSGH